MQESWLLTQLGVKPPAAPLMPAPWLMHICTVQLIPKELHQFTEGTGTDNAALLRIALTGPLIIY